VADERCPNCGAELPPEAGQHAIAPAAGVVECPSCGEKVTLQKPGAAEPEDTERAAADVPRASESVGGEEGAPESFSGEETVGGVMDELEKKAGGPEGGS
jgi:uncharacterized Zn finger protein (UPF0148 family)